MPRFVAACSGVLCLLLLATSVHAQNVNGALRWLGQVRDGDQSRETEAPNAWDGIVGLDGLPHATSMETSFYLERDFGTDDGVSDFYAGFMRTHPIPELDLTLGRQFLGEGPGGVFVADGGKVRIDPGWPVELTLYGGAPRYFEPTYSTDIQSQDEVLFGGNVATTRLAGTRLSIGYLQLERDDHVLRQLVTGTGSRVFSSLPGSPSVYGSVAYDADHQNLDLATGGANLLWAGPRLHINIEGSYYQPQDEETDRPVADIDRREDAIFQMFSIGEMGQARLGLQHPLSRTVSALADYSFQHYDQQEDGERQNAHVASAGILWMPGGDGLEVVRVEYYLIDTEDDSVNGGKVYYENRVYERLSFRTKLDVAYYDKVTNQTGTALSSFLAVGYQLCRGLEWEINFEANHNERFDHDLRFGFVIEYEFQNHVDQLLSGRKAS